jgi:hypothetical protein
MFSQAGKQSYPFNFMGLFIWSWSLMIFQLETK